MNRHNKMLEKLKETLLTYDDKQRLYVNMEVGNDGSYSIVVNPVHPKKSTMVKVGKSDEIYND